MQVATQFEPHDHAVQFYADETFLADTVADYLRVGAEAGERLLLLLTAPHLDAVLQRLEAAGLDTGTAMSSGQLVAYDADLALESIMRDGMPVEALFERHLLAGIEAASPVTTRAFGELVNLLCARGNAEAAVQLEALWHTACHRLPMTLLCSYALQHFARPEDQAAFDAICDHHSHVLPAEHYSRLEPRQQLREVSRLQQQVQALHHESASRRLAEQNLAAVQRLYGGMLTELADDGSDRLALHAELREALPLGKLELYYLPTLSARSGQVVAISAQPRWRSSRLGTMEPARWRSLAEEAGQAAIIDQWVLARACRHAKAWIDAGIDLRVAVQVSTAELLNGEIIDRVGEVLEHSGLPGEMLELELSESGLMRDPQRAAVMLERLKTLGVRLTVDEFGSGQSILEHLNRFPLDTITIHKTFIAGCLDTPHHQAIIESMIGMAHQLELQVSVGGVATRAQADYLRQQGCDLLRGPLWSRMEYRDASDEESPE